MSGRHGGRRKGAGRPRSLKRARHYSTRLDETTRRAISETAKRRESGESEALRYLVGEGYGWISRRDLVRGAVASAVEGDLTVDEAVLAIVGVTAAGKAP